MSAAALTDGSSAVKVRRLFLNFPTLSPICMNSLTCLNVYANLNGSIKMTAQETWPLQWSANPPTDQLNSTCSLKANRQVTAPLGNALTAYQSGISCGEVSPIAIMAWLREILPCCYFKIATCTFKTKWCALQWRRFSANPVWLFFTVNIGLRYDTPLKKQLPVLLLERYLRKAGETFIMLNLYDLGLAY